MKKIFKLIALMALVLPLMVACQKKDKNEPENPEDPNSFETPEDWLEHWTTSDPDSAENVVAINEANLIGLWERYGYAEVLEGSTEIGNWSTTITSSVTDNWYLQLDADKTFVEYNIYDANRGASTKEALTATQVKGTWTLSDSTLLLLYDGRNEPDKMTITLLETDRLVMTTLKDAWSGNGTLSTYYSIYQRISALPTMPLSITERLTQKPWRLVSDSVYFFKPNENGEQILLNIETGLLPQNATFTFLTDSTLTVRDASNAIVGEYTWFNSAEFVVLYSETNPLNLPYFLYFYPDYAGTTAVFISEEYYHVDNEERLKSIVYHMEMKP